MIPAPASKRDHFLMVVPAVVTVDPSRAPELGAEHHQRLVQQPLGLEILYIGAIIAWSRIAALRGGPSPWRMVSSSCRVWGHFRPPFRTTWGHEHFRHHDLGGMPASVRWNVVTRKSA